MISRTECTFGRAQPGAGGSPDILKFLALSCPSVEASLQRGPEEDVPESRGRPSEVSTLACPGGSVSSQTAPFPPPSSLPTILLFPVLILPVFRKGGQWTPWAFSWRWDGRGGTGALPGDRLLSSFCCLFLFCCVMEGWREIRV